jgi:hypothetical protein
MQMKMENGQCLVKADGKGAHHNDHKERVMHCK